MPTALDFAPWTLTAPLSHVCHDNSNQRIPKDIQVEFTTIKAEIQDLRIEMHDMLAQFRDRMELGFLEILATIQLLTPTPTLASS